MKRYMIFIEADIPILATDLMDVDYLGIDIPLGSVDAQKERAEQAAANAVQRIVGHTGIQVIHTFCTKIDEI